MRVKIGAFPRPKKDPVRGMAPGGKRYGRTSYSDSMDVHYYEMMAYSIVLEFSLLPKFRITVLDSNLQYCQNLQAAACMSWHLCWNTY